MAAIMANDFYATKRFSLSAESDKRRHVRANFGAVNPSPPHPPLLLLLLPPLCILHLPTLSRSNY